MKDRIKQIYRLKDLTDQFFCYVNEYKCQVMFSQYMLNLEGWQQRTNLGYLPKLENCELYFRRTESLGCPVFHISPIKTIDSIFLGQGLESISKSLNGPLSTDFDIKPNIESEMQMLNMRSLKLFAPQFQNLDLNFKETKKEVSESNVVSNPVAGIMILVTVVIIILLFLGYDNNVLLN